MQAWSIQACTFSRPSCALLVFHKGDYGSGRVTRYPEVQCGHEIHGCGNHP
jgi:hypothetical protein